MSSKLLFAVITFLSLSSFAFEMPGATLLKACTTRISVPADHDGQPPESHQIDIKIFQKQNQVIGTFTNHYNGSPFTKSYSIEPGQFSVRSGLTGNMQNMDQLNLGEKVIDHALFVTQDPEVGKYTHLSFDLQKVRSVKIWKTIEDANLGITALAEVSDEKGQVLGTFLGGFLVSECF